MQGARPGFAWAVPRYLQPKVDILGPLAPVFEERQEMSNEDMHFIVPDIATVGRAGIAPDSELMLAPMCYSRFVDLTRRVVQAMGFESVKVTTYSLRRFLPSIADVLKFPDPRAQAIGEWAEIPKGIDGRAKRA